MSITQRTIFYVKEQRKRLWLLVLSLGLLCSLVFIGLSFLPKTTTHHPADFEPINKGYSSSVASNTDSNKNTNSAVILQYHHVDDTTPRSTSVTPQEFEQHIEWMLAEDFKILPLPEIIETLQNQRAFSDHRIAAITFDDANISVCDKAWPILRKHNIPFTLFISTDAIEKGFTSQCSWQALKSLLKSGLMTPANHSHSHLNMISSPEDDTERFGKVWENAMRNEIETAQKLIQSRLGKASYLFAYPYGEYNEKLTKMVTQLGYIGFGQHSGAAGPFSDFSALPRFPVSSQHANLDTLKTKLLSLAFPVQLQPQQDNPIAKMSHDNPPQLVLKALDNTSDILAKTACFNSQGEALTLQRHNDKITLKSPVKLGKGRHRYTCTAKSPFQQRFYWISHQWLID